LQEGLTGLVENPITAWLHPFRAKLFSVMELSPFPFAKFPLKAGQRWPWKLDDIDDRWSDPRLIQYRGKVTATYEYSVIGHETVQTPLGNLECSVIKATAKSRLGTSSLKSYFHSRLRLSVPES
jgi:hypothetical protein